MFQLTAARRRLATFFEQQTHFGMQFQLTAARRRLVCPTTSYSKPPRFNSQPPEGGWVGFAIKHAIEYSFNSQPPEGGWSFRYFGAAGGNRFNSQPPEGGWIQAFGGDGMDFLFQLTAARRRLDPQTGTAATKAPFQLTAARRRLAASKNVFRTSKCFNSQPPEGGWKA